MSMKNNHNCAICGTAYYHCNDCNNMRTFIPWRKIACSHGCYQAFLVLNSYNYKQITKAEAQEMLQGIDFDTRTALPELQAVFAEITAPETSAAPKTSKKVTTAIAGDAE